MPTYWEVDAEVAGGFGDGIDWDPGRQPALVGPVHHEFAGWLGDDLVTTSPFWIVTERLAEALVASGVSGFVLDEVVVTKDEQWDLVPHGHELPDRWRRLVPTGTRGAGHDVVAEDRDTRLLVSDAALAVLRTCTLDEAVVRPVDQPVEHSPTVVAASELSEATYQEEQAELAARAAGGPSPALLRPREPGEPVRGDLLVVSAALGKADGHPTVDAVRALVPGPFEVEDLGREVRHADRAHGLLLTFVDGVLHRVALHPRRTLAYGPFPGRTSLVDGLDLARAMRDDVLVVFGEPASERERYPRYELDGFTVVVECTTGFVTKVVVRRPRA